MTSSKDPVVRRDRDMKKHRDDDKEDEDKDKDKRHHRTTSGDRTSRRRRHRTSRDEDGESNEEDDDSRSESDDEDDDDRKKRRHRRHRKSSSNNRKPKKSRKSKKSRSSKKHKKRSRSSSSSDDDDSSSASDSDSDSSSSTSSSDERPSKKSKKVNERLLIKLEARGETLEERKERRAQKRAAKIQARFGYTAEENPFNDPNLHETFTWSKKKEKGPTVAGKGGDNLDTLQEIDTIRQRRKDREAERDEMDRLRAEESRMKELENYDDWARKEEEFHLEQQRKRSAIRLVEGREKPIDVLAKNLLLFGLSEEEKNHRAAVKYKERYNALDQLDQLEAELAEPQKIVGVLKLVELKDLLEDINTFQRLEREGMSEGSSKNAILLYWDTLQVVVRDEIKLLQNGGDNSPYAKKVASIREIFSGQSKAALLKMSVEIDAKLAKKPDDAMVDKLYWSQVKEQLVVQLSKLDLSELHSKMLIRQLERLEQRREELAKLKAEGKEKEKQSEKEDDTNGAMVPLNVSAEFGNAEEEFGETDEVAVDAGKTYSWQDRYAPRKPRYFNRVKTGYDWNKYNQTHYDHENPPPKTVQGYKFNVFYPDLVDPTKTPQFFVEPADSNDFCILRFHAGPPYEDVAFKIINREWNRSRKRGFKSTFERGVLSLYFNFATHWYRR